MMNAHEWEQRSNRLSAININTASIRPMDFVFAEQFTFIRWSSIWLPLRPPKREMSRSRSRKMERRHEKWNRTKVILWSVSLKLAHILCTRMIFFQSLSPPIDCRYSQVWFSEANENDFSMIAYAPKIAATRYGQSLRRGQDGWG